LSGTRATRLRHRLRVVEAALLLSAYPVVTRILSVRRLLGLAGIEVAAAGEPLRPAASPIARAVGLAVEVAALRLPWKPLCLPQATVAGLMLQRRGHRSAMCFGVRRNDAALSAHAWLIVRGADGGVVCGGAPLRGLSPFGPLLEIQPK
jgi:hypothetical protein